MKQRGSWESGAVLDDVLTGLERAVRDGQEHKLELIFARGLELVRQFLPERQLLLARPAPLRPEVKDDELAALSRDLVGSQSTPLSGLRLVNAQLSQQGEVEPCVQKHLVYGADRRVFRARDRGRAADEQRDGVALANRVTSAAEFALRSARSGDTVDIPPLVIVSTDIETFGHHHRFGEMALARAMDEWDAHGGLRRCVVADYLDEVGVHRDGWLVERTAWSCGHGVERWRSECGCRFESGTSQSWRRPLRDVLDAVDDAARRIMEGEADRDLVDPWAARDDYGTVLAASGTPSSGQVRASFLASHAASGTDPQRVWAWMEAERLRLEAWSSCAWFFDTADRIETRQTVHQATEAVRRPPRRAS